MKPENQVRITDITTDGDTEWIDMNYENLYFIQEVIGVPVW